tara:strand:- start:2899 stop:3651 length:753 start_codon:yes stop_codon:yes gene_type:complete
LFGGVGEAHDAVVFLVEGVGALGVAQEVVSQAASFALVEGEDGDDVEVFSQAACEEKDAVQGVALCALLRSVGASCGQVRHEVDVTTRWCLVDTAPKCKHDHVDNANHNVFSFCSSGDIVQGHRPGVALLFDTDLGDIVENSSLRLSCSAAQVFDTPLHNVPVHIAWNNTVQRAHTENRPLDNFLYTVLFGSSQSNNPSRVHRCGCGINMQEVRRSFGRSQVSMHSSVLESRGSKTRTEKGVPNIRSNVS